MGTDLSGPGLDGRLNGLLRAAADECRRQGRPILASLTEPIPLAEPIALFHDAARTCTDRLLWMQPDCGFWLLGLGTASVIENGGQTRFSQTATAWNTLCSGALIEPARAATPFGPLMMGGFSFDSGQPESAAWKGFPEARMVLPRACVTGADGRSWLTLNAVVRLGIGPEEEAFAMARMRNFVLSGQAGVGEHLSCANSAPCPKPMLTEIGSTARWREEVAAAAAAARRGDLRKVVLARAVRLQATQPFSPTKALRRLAAGYPTCVVFALARGEDCFLGATPERLLRVRNGEVSTTCLAGSYARGASEEADRQLAEALLADPKERSEHALVLNAMTETMSASCTELEIPDAPAVLKLRNVQHLSTPLSGRMAPGQSILRIVERLHPTPSVGGAPREVALKFIRAREGLDRGWYAGAVGWVDHKGEGDFAVAIRAALLRGAQATLFAGCGIVADSDPEREFAESCIKLTPMLTALGAA